MFGLDKRGFDSRAERQRKRAKKFLPALNEAERGYFMEITRTYPCGDCILEYVCPYAYSDLACKKGEEK